MRVAEYQPLRLSLGWKECKVSKDNGAHVIDHFLDEGCRVSTVEDESRMQRV